MLRARLSEIASWIGAAKPAADALVHGVSTDSRRDRPGALFVALSGPRHDGHCYVAEAAARGCVAALVSRPVDAALPQLRVADTLRALQALAAAWLDRCAALRLALTGSNGKTTVKNLLAGILARHGSCHATAGNLNNEIGLPLTALALAQDCRYAVFELGAGRPGDIAELTAIARPQIALVNNVGPAHLERLGGLDGVAETKGAIYARLGAGDVAVINADDAYAASFVERAGAARVLRFALMDETAEVGAEQLSLEATASRFVLRLAERRLPVVVPLPGRHNVMNALAAAACAYAAGVPDALIGEGLAAAQPSPGRYRELRQPAGWTLVDDSYNANPASLEAGLRTLCAAGGDAWLALGDMAELGPEAAALHAACGRLARELGVRRLFGLGPLSAEAVRAFGAGGEAFDDASALVARIASEVTPGVRVLVKGSRSSAMERVVHALDARQGGEG